MSWFYILQKSLSTIRYPLSIIPGGVIKIASKMQSITELYEIVSRDITRNRKSWTDFLRSACRNYKCPFDEQLLIYAQRPDATAVLELEKWNSLFGRWVNRGAVGIAVLRKNPHESSLLKYYFDISDTHENALSRPISLWRMKPEHEPEVIETLENAFGELQYKYELADAIFSASQNMVTDNLPDYLSDLMDCRDNSLLEELDGLNVQVMFKRAVVHSVAYMMMARCGLSPEDHFYQEDFQEILSFNTPQTLNILGAASSDIAEMGLREIATTVQSLTKNPIRTFAQERDTSYNESEEQIHHSERGVEHGTDIHETGRLSDSRPDDTGGTGDYAGKIRADAPKLSPDPPERAVHEPPDDGQAEPTPDGNRTDGSRADGTDGQANGRGTGLDRETESVRPDGVGGPDEQHTAFSGGIDPPGTDLQLTSLPTVEEQISSIEKAEEEKSSAFSVSQEDIDAVLQSGSSSSHGKYRIYFHFQEFHTEKETIAFLKNEHGWGGGTFSYPDGTRGWQNHDTKGVHISKSGSFTSLELVLSWKKVAKRIRELMDADRYLSPREKENIPQYLEYLENAEISRQKNDFIDSAADLPPAEKKDSLSLRLADYLNGLEGYEKKYLEKHGLSELSDTNAGFMDELLSDPKKVGQLIDALASIQGATCAVFTRKHAWRFGEELKELHPRRHIYHLGDTVHIGSSEYEVAAYDDETVRLFDISFPLLNKEMTRDEFDRKIRENPANDHLIKIDNEELIVENEGIASGEENNSTLSISNSQLKAPYTPKVSDQYEIEGRRFEVDSVDTDLETVSLRDITFQNTTGFPVFRSETLDFIRQYEPEPLMDNEELIVENEGVASGGKNHSPLSTINSQFTQRRSMTRTFDPHPKIPQADRHNFTITDDDLGHGGAKTKFRYNIEAIKLLREIELENRLATPEEQEVISKYVGWGGLPQAFDPENKQWENEYFELHSLLSPEEYASARATVLNAHYTSPVVIRAIYKAIENMGFKTGNILDPGCGIGNFQGLLPDSMKDSKVFGVEIDPITGKIAQQLYQKNSIAIQGFEKTDLPDSFFDLAIGNVPFGSYGVADRRYDKHKFLIHDFFFAKTLDKIRPGGIVAFITSKGTLDKKDPSVRKYIAQRAELLGAIRLPNNAFKDNAGTEVTTDIIFLQKRDRMVDVEPEWVQLSQLIIENEELTIPVNSYFAEHPEMILGEMTHENRMYGNAKDTTCKPFPDSDLGELLDEAIVNIHGEFMDNFLEDDLREAQDGSSVTLAADPNVRNFSYTIVDGQIYYRQDSRMNPVELSATAQNRVKGMIQIRDCLRTVMDYQTADYPDTVIQREQEKLNRLYDEFTRKYGLITSRANTTVFTTDSSYPLLCSLEVLDENRELKRKADIFTKRTIRPYTPVTHVDTASEALAVSIAEKARVDLPFMAQLTGKDEETIVHDLQGVIFRVPDTDSTVYGTADEYLSGNVREKLQIARFAAEKDPAFTVNVEALESVQPPDISAGDISVRLGATWIPTDDIRQFIIELLDPPFYNRHKIVVHYSSHTGQWNITGKSVDIGNIKAYNTYGIQEMGAYKILEDTLNLRSVKVYRTVYENGEEKRVVDTKKTGIAQSKQEAIKLAFIDWIWKDPDRRQRLTRLYNDRFNNTRPREYDGQHIQFPGMNPEIRLRPHQTGAIARILYGGNTLLAHVVGAGKTFEMVAAAQESKRLGLCSKSMFVVPNHLTEQWASEYLQLYPSANILVTTKKDFETKNRKKFCARIATGDYDAIIIGHSQFERIPVSMERQEAFLQQQIDEITEGIQEIKHNNGKRFTIKQLEKSKKALRVKLEKLHNQERKDDVVTFEELGIDRLFVDEAHGFKNLFMSTKMRNVAGISQTEAQKSSDMFMKCRYMDDLTGGRGVVFATGTPISNSMVEMYTMQRYLQNGLLHQNGLALFDAWASTFGETVTSIELSPEGTGYRPKTRFAKFYNIPELMSMFREVADVQTADMLKLPVPKANFHNVAIQPTEMQREIVAGLADRADDARNGRVPPYIDNMLKITTDGRKVALDQRLYDEDLPDSEHNKSSVCAEHVFDIWEKTGENRSAQLVFCDYSTPKKDGSFSVYNDLRDKLIAKGIPAEEIAFIHDYNTDAKKDELFSKVRSGQIRVLMGSTQKMGAGTNVQDRLVALHDLDCPWRPSDLEQRLGRIVRQGNTNPEVDIFRYVTEGTFDAYSYQLVESKQKFISQIMTGKAPVRSAEDVDEAVLSYAEIKALATGNPKIKEKMDLDVTVNKLKLLKSNYLNERYMLEDKVIREIPIKMEGLREQMEGYDQDIRQLDSHAPPEKDAFPPMVIYGQTYVDKGEAGQALLEACKNMKSSRPVSIGSHRGFEMVLSYDTFSREFQLTLKHALRHTIELGKDVHGNITRIHNVLENLPARRDSCRVQMQRLEEQRETAKEELEKPFAQEDELREKSARLSDLNIELNLDEKDNGVLDAEPEAYGAGVKKRDRGAR